ncbi:MAG: indolepyruvate ferredoxin oxidoreductase subunit alpha [Spirochaetales bacterium]|nr:indolepyruvate ferredoxin oxidoreductase subunit alpha [Spirochaetales bacterium]
MKKLLTGNEAIAQGAWEAGVKVASAYPGTPSTEILEYFATLEGVYAEWAPNEKVAFEVASGAAIGGLRSLTAMKHVGLNVAADPLFTMAYEGINGGFVVVSADDPGMHSSQNEQDNRFYAMHAKVVCIEPSDSQEALDFTKAAFEISEQFDTVVLLRSTTRISHSKSIVEISDKAENHSKEYKKNIEKFIMIPANARKRHPIVEENLQKIAKMSYKSSLNKVEYNLDKKINGKKIGIITSGISYQYAKEVFEDNVSYLKFGITYPLSFELVDEFAKNVDEIFIIEENDPFLELQIKAHGIKCKGKEIIPIVGELNPDIIRKAFNCNYDEKDILKAIPVPNRPPVLCSGCPHRGIFFEISKIKKAIITGDIGCYTLGMMPPLNAMDTCICMGASISAGIGLQKAINIQKKDQKVFAFIGDSTFFHSGITGLMDAVYNKIPIVVVILDNRITAMTGHQQNPGTGKTLMGEPTISIDLAQLVKSIGVKEENIRVIHSYNLTEIKNAIDFSLSTDDVTVIISKQPCALLKDETKKRKPIYYSIDTQICKICKACLKVGCPSISFNENIVKIDPNTCFGCSICYQTCKFGAIKMKSKE